MYCNSLYVYIYKMVFFKLTVDFYNLKFKISVICLNVIVFIS